MHPAGMCIFHIHNLVGKKWDIGLAFFAQTAGGRTDRKLIC